MAHGLKKIGDLTVRLTGGSDGQGGGDGPLVVLCHGFGAPGDDLVALGEALRLPAPVRLAFPAAPLALGGPYGGGRAWWMIDIEGMARAQAAGRPRDPRTEDPPGLAEARAALGRVIDGLAAPGTAVVLGGFSQGAMVSADLAFREPGRALAGLVLLSGSFLAADSWRPGLKARAELPVFQSHGQGDPLLPYGVAEALATEMRAAGMAVDFTGFGGGHEIPPAVLAGAAGFLRRVVGRPQSA
jgi:phospholipase/carboxylesterase